MRVRERAGATVANADIDSEIPRHVRQSGRHRRFQSCPSPGSVEKIFARDGRKAHFPALGKPSFGAAESCHASCLYSIARMGCGALRPGGPQLCRCVRRTGSQVAAKAWRRVTGVFIVHFLCATLSQSAEGHSEHRTTTYNSRDGQPMSEMGVRLGRDGISALSPFYPQLRTFAGVDGTAEKCPKPVVGRCSKT